MHLNKPVTIQLLDGTTYDLYMTYGKFKKVMNKHNVKSMQQLMTQEGDLILSDVFYQCLPDEVKARLSQEQFEDLLPADMNYLAEKFAELFNVKQQKN
jgi:hypothetical protein